MPFTINGIGTRYYGRANEARTPGRCAHCGFTGILGNYETREYFCILFIPVIPLSHCRIVDECPACSRAYRLPIEKWQQMKAAEIENALKCVQAMPDDPQAAMQLHQALLRYGEVSDAERMLALFKGRFEGAPAFQQYIEANTTAAGNMQPPTARRTRARSPWRVPAIAAGVALMIFAAVYMLTGTKSVYIVNGYPAPIELSIDGGETVFLSERKWCDRRIHVGSHTAVVKREGEPEERVAFEIRPGVFARILSSETYVLNPGGAGTILFEKKEYNIRPADADFYEYSLHTGSQFMRFKGIDYPFEEFPNQIRSSSDFSSKALKSRVCLMDADPVIILGYFPKTATVRERMQYAEDQLLLQPSNGVLFEAYCGLPAKGKLATRRHDFIERQSDKRPVLIEWHRVYQSIQINAGKRPQVEERYERMLAQHPDDAALLYLRGRIATDPAQSLIYFDAAIEKDATNTYAYNAQAYHYACRGDWASARAYAALACEQPSATGAMRDFFYNARFARGEYGAIEEEARKHLKEDPTCSVCVQRLVGILMVQKRAAEADETLDLYAKALRKAEVEGRDEFLAVARLYRLYLADDMSGYEEMARKVRVELTQNYYVFVSLLEQEKADQAVELIEKAKDLKTGYAELLLAALLYRVGRVDESNAHLADAVELVRMQGEAGRIAAALLSGELPIAVESAADLSLQDSLRLILLVSLAQRNPEQRKALLERAALLNVNPDFPCRFVKRSIAAMQQEAQ